MSDLIGRKFEEIIVEYPEVTNEEHKGEPYYSIKYIENGKDNIIGFGTYGIEVLSRYIRDYFIPSADLSDYCDKLWKLAYERGKAEGQPRKGKWITDNPHSEIYRYACSECHAHHRARYDFCPSCGADMRSEAREYLEYGKLIAKGIEQGLRGDAE